MPSNGAMDTPVMPAPSMDMPNGGSPMMDNNVQMPATDSLQMQDEENPYEADFDAGVEADEESDPKKFIQQLTGKLSQSLRKYNKSLPQADADLSKYVAGMVIKQCIEGLPTEDVQDILNKVKKDDKEEAQETMENPQEQEMDVPSNEGIPQPQPSMNESEGNSARVSDQKEDKTQKTIKVPNRDSYNKQPYTGKVFK